eukprot:2103689-Rhodomonas_salina.1
MIPIMTLGRSAGGRKSTTRLASRRLRRATRASCSVCPRLAVSSCAVWSAGVRVKGSGLMHSGQGFMVKGEGWRVKGGGWRMQSPGFTQGSE